MNKIILVLLSSIFLLSLASATSCVGNLIPVDYGFGGMQGLCIGYPPPIYNCQNYYEHSGDGQYRQCTNFMMGGEPFGGCNVPQDSDICTVGGDVPSENKSTTFGSSDPIIQYSYIPEHYDIAATGNESLFDVTTNEYTVVKENTDLSVWESLLVWLGLSEPPVLTEVKYTNVTICSPSPTLVSSAIKTDEFGGKTDIRQETQRAMNEGLIDNTSSNEVIKPELNQMVSPDVLIEPNSTIEVSYYEVPISLPVKDSEGNELKTISKQLRKSESNLDQNNFETGDQLCFTDTLQMGVDTYRKYGEHSIVVNYVPTQSSNNLIVNISITNDVAPLLNLTYNWNETNISLYDPSLLIMMNFDNITLYNDTSSYHRNGTPVGGLFNRTVYKFGDSAYQFDGSTSYVNVSVPYGTLNFDTYKNFTWGVWVYPTSFATYNGILSTHKNSAGGVALYTQTDGIVKLSNTGDATKLITSGTTAINLNTWNYITISRNGTGASDLSLYLNGQLITNASGNVNMNATPTSTGLIIGRFYEDFAGLSYHGIIDEVRIWNRSMSASEVLQQYNSNLQYVNSSLWSLTATQPLRLYSNNTYSALACDTAGNCNSSGVFTYNISNSFPIAYCQNLNTAGTYTLASSLSVQGTCLNITANKVILDCQGQSITHGTTNGGIGISINGANNTILQNCNILSNLTDYGANDTYNIALYNAWNTTILNNNLTLGRNWRNFGIYETSTVQAFGLNVTGNLFFSQNKSLGQQTQGINFATNLINSSVFNNNFTLYGDFFTYGINRQNGATTGNNFNDQYNFFYINGTSDIKYCETINQVNNGTFANNFCKTDGPFSGVGFNTASGGTLGGYVVNIINNTLNSGGTGNSQFNIVLTNGFTNIQNNTLIFSSTGFNGGCIQSGSANNVTIVSNNCTVSGSNGGANYGFYVQNNNYTIFNNNLGVSIGQPIGINLNQNNNGEVWNNTIRLVGSGSSIQGIEQSNINSNGRIHDNNIYGNSTASYLHSGIQVGGTSGQNNSVWNNNITIIGGSTGAVQCLWQQGSFNDTIYNNTCYVYSYGGQARGITTSQAKGGLNFTGNTIYTFSTSANKQDDMVYTDFDLENSTIANNYYNGTGAMWRVNAQTNYRKNNNKFINNTVILQPMYARNSSFISAGATQGINDTYFQDQYLENYSIRGVQQFGWMINDTTNGQIRFNAGINGSGRNFSRDVWIAPNYIFVNASAGGVAGQGSFNQSLNITFTGMGRFNLSNVQILKNGAVCTDCYNFTDLTLNVVKINTSSAGLYQLNGTSGPPPVTPIIINFTNPTPVNYFNSTNSNYTFNVTVNQNVSSCFLVFDNNFGNGVNGAITISAVNTTVNNYTYLTNTTINMGDLSLTVNDTSFLNISDQIVIIQTQNYTGGNAGQYEFARVSNINGNTITLTSPLAYKYTSGLFNQTNASNTQVIKIPQYTNVVINSGASVIAKQWDGYSGGYVFFRANGTVTVDGTINVTGQGFRGGAGNASSPRQSFVATSGESYNGLGTSSTGGSWLANFGGGGAGYSGGSDYDDGGSGGGGGSYGTYGLYNATRGGWSSTGQAGKQGNTYGINNLNTLFLGSGGGGATGYSGQGKSGTDGGTGAGSVFIYAQVINGTGSIEAQGKKSVQSPLCDGAEGTGGSGSGGGVYLSGNTINVSYINATGGNWVAGCMNGDGGVGYADGGQGGNGRIRIDSVTTSSTVTPINFVTNYTTGYIPMTINNADASTTASVFMANMTPALYKYYAECSDNTNSNVSETRILNVLVPPLPSLSMTVLVPTGNVNATQNQYFNVTVNVTCNTWDCGPINVYLDPSLPGCDPTNADCTSACNSLIDPGLTTYGWSYQNFFAPQCYAYTNDGQLNVYESSYCSSYFGGGAQDCVEYMNYMSWDDVYCPSYTTNGNVPVTSSDCIYGTGYSAFNFASPFFAGSGGKNGLINTTIGATPFYTISDNPTNISLTLGQSQVVTFTVNATGDIGSNYTFFAFANITSNPLISNTSRTWNVSIVSGSGPAPADPLTVNLNSPANNTQTNVSLNYFSANFIDGTDLQNATLYVWNSSGANILTNSTIIRGLTNSSNLSVVLPYSGNFTWNYLVSNTTAYAWNSTNWTIWYNIPVTPDNEYPQFTAGTFNISSGSAYLFGQGYSANETITSTNGTAGIQFNNINYTSTNISSLFTSNIGILGAGTYSYYWWAYGNGTSHNYNKTTANNYVVAVASQSITPLLNGGSVNLTVTYPQQVNASYSGTNQTGVNITINGTLLTRALNYTYGAGGYNLTWFMPSNQNYSSFLAQLNLTINKASSSVSLTATTPITYPTVTDFAGSGCPDASCTLNITNQVYGAGTISANYSFNGNQNFTASSSVFTVIINQASASGVLLLNGSATNLTLEYPQKVNASFTNTTNAFLFRNATDISLLNSQLQTLGVGFYNYTLILLANQNYTAFTTNLNATITKNSSLVLTLSVTSPITYGATSDFTGGNCPSELTCSLNITNGVFGVGTIYANYSTNGNENYSATSTVASLVINSASPSSTLKLNDVSANISTSYPNQINASFTNNTLALLYRNGVDVTSLNNVFENLAVGYYNFTLLSGGGNYSSSVIQYDANITINNTFVLNVALAPASTVTFGTQTTATGSGCPDLSCNLYLDGVIKGNPHTITLGVGVYNYSYSTTGSQNYSSGSASAILTVNQASQSITPLLNGGSVNLTVTYPQQVNASYSGTNNTELIITENGIVVSRGLNYTLGVGSYNVTWSAPSNQNYTSFLGQLNATVTQGSSSISTYLNNSQANATIQLGQSILLNSSVTTGDSGATTRLYLNGTLINQGSSPLSNLTTFGQIGIFNITSYYINSQNYTSSFETWWVNVIQSATTPYFTLIPAGQTVQYPNGFTAQFNGTDTTYLPIGWMINDTRFSITQQGLLSSGTIGVNNYLINITINNTLGITNSTIYSLNVSKNSSTTLGLTVTSPITYGTASDFTGSNCPSELTCSLNISNQVYGVGTIWANYSSAGNSNYSAMSVVASLVINQASSSIFTYLNNSRSNISIYPGTSIWLNTSTQVGDNSNIRLYLNGTLINEGSSPLSNLTLFSQAGLYNITGLYINSQNYTQSSETWFVNVTTAPTIPYFQTIPSPVSIVFGQSLSAQFVGNDTSFLPITYFVNDTRFSINSSGLLTNSSVLGVLNYLVNVTIKNTLNNQNSTIYSVNVTQASSSCSITNNNPTYPTAVSVSGSCSNPEASYNLYKDGSLVSNPFSQVLAVGSYAFVLNTTSTQNYSGSSDSKTVTVSQGTGNVNLWIAGYRSNFTAYQSAAQNINITGILTNGPGVLTLYLNGSIINQGGSPATNITNLPLGFYNASVVFTGNTNLTSTIETWWINVTTNPLIAPTVTIVSPANGQTYNTQPINITITTDVSSSSCWYNLNLSASNTTLTNTSSTLFVGTLTGLTFGNTYTLNAFCSGTLGALNGSSSSTFIYSSSSGDMSLAEKLSWLFIIFLGLAVVFLILGYNFSNLLFMFSSGSLFMIVGTYLATQGYPGITNVLITTWSGFFLIMLGLYIAVMTGYEWIENGFSFKREEEYDYYSEGSFFGEGEE